MASHNYLTLDDVLGIHQDSIEAFGGSHGIRDVGGLESAAMRPQSGYYADVIAEAAALWASLSQNHPFLDGNKRTAITLMAAHTYLPTSPIVLSLLFSTMGSQHHQHHRPQPPENEGIAGGGKLSFCG